MISRWWRWGGLLVALVVLLALAMVTVTTERLAAGAVTARQQARTVERARAALWRMDSDIIGRLALLDAQGPLPRPGAPLLPASWQGDGAHAHDSLPLCAVLVRADDGTLRDVPAPASPDDHAARGAAAALLADDSALVAGGTQRVWTVLDPLATQTNAAGTRQGDFDQRSNAFNNINAIQRPAVVQLAPGLDATTAFRPLLLHGQHLVATRMAGGGREVVVLDWPRIRGRLLVSITDLLPHAQLRLCTDTAAVPYPLAALPVALVPGPWTDPEPAAEPLALPLATAWIAVLLALAAVVVCLVQALAWAERKAAFSAAMSHELRTPVTTLRLYADMLTNGMVSDEAARADYLRTLHVEAERLGTLIENVLSFARLERLPRPVHLAVVGSDDVIQAACPGLQRRATQSGMELVLELPPETQRPLIAAEPGMVEQILANLVDNACRYAPDATDRRIHLILDRVDQVVRITVRDHGPGVAATLRRRLFTPYHRGAGVSAARGGLGLGLALSRRMARHQGGDLRYRHGDDGSSFILTLPVGRPQA